MSEMEREKLISVAEGMGREERIVMMSVFPMEDLLEVIYLKYTDMKVKQDGIAHILNNYVPITEGGKANER